MIRTVVAPVAPVAQDRTGLLSALAVARSLGAHLDAAFVRPDPKDVFIYLGLDPTVADQANREQRTRVEADGLAAAEQAETRFAVLCRETGIAMVDGPTPAKTASARWQVLVGDPAIQIPEYAKAHDMAIFTGAFTSYHLLLENALETTLLRSGRPVLFLPEATGPSSPDLGHALIAWDGGGGAARAVSAWLATGQVAQRATVLQLSEASEYVAEPTEVLEHLSWHGISAKADIRPRGFDSLGASLVTAARENGAGVIVMGGYGHNRYREAVLGGMTRHVIRNAPMPVLMAH
ncbi:universal stress protein [Mameliella sp. CS4]|uniref:universal stress protein n=1 Tax=Mameliella sp. CS4 TaxID=2862329 RepID=UPI001C5FF336|nr:universal stress protein [Mameliella sp. CS4]MBW4982723.1 universal stress protein [Mameliella sp. CS4]